MQGHAERNVFIRNHGVRDVDELKRRLIETQSGIQRSVIGQQVRLF